VGSAGAMLTLPALAAAAGPSSPLTAVALLGYAWLALWAATGREIPHRESVIPLTSRDIEDGEKRAASASAAHPGPQGPNKARPSPTPYGRMLRHPAIWAIVACNFAFHYAFYVVMNWLPTYCDALLGAPLSSLGGLKALPYLIMFAATNAGAWAGDGLMAARRWPPGRARKAVNTAGFGAAVLALLAMPAAGGVGTGMLAVSLTLGTLGLSRGGFAVNHMDVAPRWAGVVMGVSNTAGTVAGVVGVAATGLILERAGGAGVRAGWYAAHAVSALVCTGAAAGFALFARGERLFD